MSKKKIIIIISIVLLLILFYFLYSLFGVNIQIKINYNVSVPIADTKIYNHNDGIGRDTSYYNVVKYNKMKLRRLEKLDWKKELNEINQSQVNYYEELIKYLKDNNIQKKYYPIIDNNTLYFIKKFDDKRDYLLMIYNKKTSIVNIFEFHI